MIDFKNLKTGDLIKINEKEFEIIQVMDYDVECLPPKYQRRNIISFSLIEKNSKRITSTHSLSYYLDTKEINCSKNLVESTKLKKEQVELISSQP